MVHLTGSAQPVSFPVAKPTAGDVEGQGAISVPPTGTADPSWLEDTMGCRDTDSEAAGTTAVLAITEPPATTCGPLREPSVEYAKSVRRAEKRTGEPEARDELECPGPVRLMPLLENTTWDNELTPWQTDPPPPDQSGPR
ncbi:hypothetical protein XENORESO_011499 [Xenotaenia resolanae]|uniref:Uncharacterized protein n=1 Tax=Xenotaenia resolanae TaxID=208358 RepID=A0ABV0W3Y3_9TELE